MYLWLIRQFANWFPQAQAQIQAQAAELEAKVTQSSLNQSSPTTLAYLQEKVEALTSPQSYQDALLSKLEEVLAQWQEQEDAPNSLIVLGSPVQSLSLLLNETLALWQQRNIVQLKFLNWSARPQDFATIQAQLQQEIGSFLNSFNQDSRDKFLSVTATRSEEKDLLVIPDLSWCFLRCVDGFDGIEYLRDLIVQEPSVFWLIGCNDWVWEYLDRVCQLSTYCEQTFPLPALTDIELKQWLNPVSQTIKFKFSDGQDNQINNGNDRENNQEDWISSAEKDYFARLADLSLGINSIAGKLWLNSLYIQESEAESDNDRTSETEDNSDKNLLLKNATLPRLPNLTKDDRYLLLSLGLHGRMSLSELARSLGETESRVQSQVNILRRLGVIERRKGLIWLNPTHYSRLKQDLANNHFLLGEDN